MKKILSFLALSILIAVNPAHSDGGTESNTQTNSDGENKQKLNPWTQCGIGAMIFSGESDGWAIAAGFSNIIWDLGTTAVSSNISSQNTCNRANVKTAMFIDENLNELEQQTAQGYGNHIDAMLDLYQCDSSVRPDIVSNLRRNMITTVSTDNYTALSHSEKAFSYYSSVETAVENFSKSCQTI